MYNVLEAKCTSVQLCDVVLMGQVKWGLRTDHWLLQKMVTGNSRRALSVAWWGMNPVLKGVGGKKLDTVNT